MMFPYDFGFQVQMPWNVVGDLSMGCLTISSPQPCHLGLKHMRNKQDHPPILGKKKGESDWNEFIETYWNHKPTTQDRFVWGN